MAKFLSEAYVRELEAALKADPKWTESTKSVKTSILMVVTDNAESYLLAVDSGTTTMQKAEQGTQAEFTLEGAYESWAKVAKGEMDIQSAVLKGQLKFKGSITKILVYRDRFLRIAEVMKTVPKEF
jgi:putative sterol carrier protein